MSQTIGFLLITHRNADQIQNLSFRLGLMFGAPPIAIHHDSSQELLDGSSFPENVRFVDPIVPTDWGGFSVVKAQFAALKLLYEFADPDWVVLLSAADYPIQTAERILADLGETPYDAFLDSRLIEDLGEPYHDGSLGGFPFAQRLYLQTAYNRYVAQPLLSRKMARRLKTPVEAWVVKSSWIRERRTPFQGNVRCFAGDAWFTVNRRVAHFFLEDTPLRKSLFDHYKSRASPEESIYHTLLGNTSLFRVAPSNLRYTDWEGCYAHPRVLGREDFSKLLASKDHFARKFPNDLEMLSELDQLIQDAAYDGAAQLTES